MDPALVICANAWLRAQWGSASSKLMRGLRGITRVREVHWLRELGIAQALWVLEVDRLGPFLVEGDAEGRSLFALANREINLRIAEVYKTLPPPALARFGEILSRTDEVV